MDKQSETITGWRNAANHGRGSEMTNVIHAACDALETALDRIKVLERVVSRCNGEFKAIAMMHRIDVDEAIAATSAALSGKEKV